MKNTYYAIQGKGIDIEIPSPLKAGLDAYLAKHDGGEEILIDSIFMNSEKAMRPSGIKLIENYLNNGIDLINSENISEARYGTMNEQARGAYHANQL